LLADSHALSPDSRTIRSPSTGVPSGFLPDEAEWKRAEKGTPTLPVEGLRMSRLIVVWLIVV
jgi:hypothetical protein